MRIGIDASRAFLKQRTGIEEYSFWVLKNLASQLAADQVVLYLRKGQKAGMKNDPAFKIPANWQIKELPFIHFWTQVGLAWEMLIDPVEALLVPAHTVPWIHPENTVVTIHGLEYEHCPESYSLYSRWFHRFFIRHSCRWAKKIVAVYQKTKQDLVKMYAVPAEKIEVVYNGFESDSAKIMSVKKTMADKHGTWNKEQKTESQVQHKNKVRVKKISQKYLLYLGRLEKRKNIEGIVKAFDLLKQKYGYVGELVLAGKPGHGYEEIKKTISKLPSRCDIIELGFVSDEEKWQLLKRAEIFFFPSLSEGFGIPIIEAQSQGVPVITSDFGPMDEVAGNDDILVNPQKPEEIAKLANRILTNKGIKERIIKAGLKNIKKFSWEECAKQLAVVIKNNV